MLHPHAPHTALRRLVWLALLLLVACGGPGPQPPGDQTVLSERARVLDDAGLAALSAVGEDSLSFASVSPVLAQTVVGDLLIVGISERSPYGALRRVESVQADGAGLLIGTSPASLSDAFEELHVRIERRLDLDSDAAALRSQLAWPSQAGLSLPYRLTASGGGGSVELSGSVSMAPELDLVIDIDIASFSLEELSLSFSAYQTFLAELRGEGSIDFDESIDLITIPFTPVVIVLPIPGGTVPLVFTPALVIEAGLEGGISGEVEGSVTQEASFTAGIGYQNGEFGGFSESDSSFVFEQPVYGASLGVRAVAGARMEVLLYGLVGPYASAEAYVEFSASLEDGPPPCLSGVLQAGIGAKAGVQLLEDYETVLFRKAFRLAEFDGCTPGGGGQAQPAITWARALGRAGSLGERARAVAEAPDGSFLVVGDSSLADGITGAAASVWALRLDPIGQVMWQHAYPLYGGIGYVKSAAAVADGFLIATGLGLMKLDPGGNPRWFLRYEAGIGQQIESMAVLPDGGALLAGAVGNPTTAWVMRVDAQGQVQWSRSYTAGQLNRIRLTPDGGAIAVGSHPGRASDVLLLKLNAAGQAEWLRLLNNPADNRPEDAEGPPLLLDTTDSGMDAAPLPGGRYVVVAETYGAFPVPEPGQAGHYAAWVVELEADGSLPQEREARQSWVHRAPNDANYDSAYAVAVRPNGSYVVFGQQAGQATDLFQSEDVLLIQGGAYAALGGAGNDTILGGGLGGGVGSAPVQVTADGGILMAATSDSFGSQEQFWIVKLGRNANINFPYRQQLPGDAFRNEDSVSSPATATVQNVPVSAAPRTIEFFEATPLTGGWQKR